MDRIRKALDLARMERAKPAEVPGGGQVSAPLPHAAAPVRSPLTSIVYTRSRIFRPSPATLEANRVMNPGSNDPAAVAFRMLRTQVLQRMEANGWRSLAIFSPRDHDGKTTTAINLALSLANDRRHTVLLVDYDFRHPMAANRLGLAPESGAEDLLVGDLHVEDCLYHPEGFDRFLLLPARGPLMNSSEVLAAPRSRELVRELRDRYPDRIVVFDLPPVLQADDALAFAPLIECGLVVAAEGKTRRADLTRTIELLHKTPLVGTVLNRAADAPRGY